MTDEVPPVPRPQGIFTGEEDGTRITCVDRSLNGLVVAAGDGYSRVRLYRYPCPGDRPPPALFHELRGHGAGGVSRARFLRGGTFLITIGGSDRREKQSLGHKMCREKGSPLFRDTRKYTELEVCSWQILNCSTIIATAYLKLKAHITGNCLLDKDTPPSPSAM